MRHKNNYNLTGNVMSELLRNDECQTVKEYKPI